MPRPADRLLLRVVAPALAVGTVLAGCADMYYDRRETVSFHAGDAVASNAAVQIIDPWPRAAADRGIAHDGERMQSAIERYRTNRTTPLMTTSTSSVSYAAPTGNGAALTK